MGLKQERLDSSAVRRRIAGGPARRLPRGQGQDREVRQRSHRELGPWAPRIPALPSTSCMTWDKILNLCVLQSPHR